MKVVIIEFYTWNSMIDESSTKNVENVYGPFSEDGINDKIIELEKKRETYNTTFEIMPLIEKI
jgi:hypothetical protein